MTDRSLHNRPQRSPHWSSWLAEPCEHDERIINTAAVLLGLLIAGAIVALWIGDL